MADGIFGNANGFFTPERSAAFQALGLGLSQLGAGQQVNLSQPLAALQKRQQDAKTREQLEGLSGRFTPDQQAILATMSPAQAAQIIAQDAFRAPAAPTKGVVINGQLVNPITGQPMGDFRTPETVDPVRGVNINGQLVNPVTGDPIADFRTPDVPVHQMTGAQINAINGVTPGTPGALEPGATFNVDDGKITAIGGGGVNVSTTIEAPGPTSPAGETFDKDLGVELSQFQLTGAASASKNLAQLKSVREGLASGSSGNVTGPVTGPLSSLPIVGPTFFPAAIDAREQVAGVVQQSLKEILGGAFSEKEGEALIARAFNPDLDEATNLKRIDRLIRQLELAFEQKMSAANYFAQNGTLAGWQGKIPTINDFDILSEDAPAPRERLKYNTATGEFE